jgi:hypothetical protein
MESEGNTRLIQIKICLREKLDLFVRFMRSKWLAYLFIMAYIIMLFTLLVMVGIIVRFSFISSEDSQPEDESHPLKTNIPSNTLDSYFGLLGLVAVLALVLGYGHHRCSSYYSTFAEYQQI